MKKKLSIVVMGLFMLFVVELDAQVQNKVEDVPGGTGKRAYIDLNPASSTEIAPGVRTFFAWAKDPKSGTYFKFVSVEESLFKIFDRVTQSVVQGEKVWANDSAIVVEGPIMDEIFIKEILNAYKNSSRILSEVSKENSAVQTAENNISDTEDEIDDLKESLKEAKSDEKSEIRKSISDSKQDLRSYNDDLSKALSDRNAGVQRRSKEYREVESLLYEMLDAGFCYLKNHAFVAISDILTKELPTRITDGSNQNLQSVPSNRNQAPNNSQQNPGQSQPQQPQQPQKKKVPF